MVIFITLACGVAFVLGRVVASPELGSAVRGPDHGETPASVAAHMAVEIAPQLIGGPHAEVVLSEHDLTVIAAARNPNPAKFSSPEVRFRNSYILLSANTTIGPLHTVAVAHVSLVLTGVAGGNAHIETDIVELDAGRQGVPDFLRSAIDPRGSGVLSLDSVFNDNAALQALRQSLECVYIADDGLHLGFHRPGAAPDPTDCVPPAAPVVSAAH